MKCVCFSREREWCTHTHMENAGTTPADGEKWRSQQWKAVSNWEKSTTKSDNACSFFIENNHRCKYMIVVATSVRFKYVSVILNVCDVIWIAHMHKRLDLALDVLFLYDLRKFTNDNWVPLILRLKCAFAMAGILVYRVHANAHALCVFSFFFQLKDKTISLNY